MAVGALAMTLVMPAREGFGYRPFVSTDAAVADEGEVEIEFGYAGFREDHGGVTILAPQVVANLGVVRDIEAVAEFDLANDLTPRRGENPTRFEDTEVSLKWVMREGVLQERPGPSIALELSALLPTLRNEDRPGGELVGILSNTGLGLTYHLNAGALVEPAGSEPGIMWGVILERAIAGGLRAVAEVNGESVRKSATDSSALIGAIWSVAAPAPLHELSFDVGVRRGLSRAAADWGGTAGFTFDFPWERARTEERQP